MITFIGAGKVKPGMMDQALEAARRFMPTIKAEEGTLKYVVYRGTQDPNMLVFFEQYQDEAAQAAHMSSEEMKVFQAAITPCIEGAPIMGNVEEAVSASD
jgi:quinol monooxygenase YgiN